MSYEGLVEAGRAARERADDYQWEEGDLALQVEHLPSTERPRDPEGLFIEDQAKALKRYAIDIDLAYRTLATYRRVADAWPSTSRAHCSWDVHRALAAQDDRFDLIRPDMTVRQAEDIVRKRNAASRGEPGWRELLGTVGDTLIKADKQLERAEHAITRKPADDLQAKAAKYADHCLDLARRLRNLGQET